MFQRQWWAINLSRNRKGLPGQYNLPPLPKKGVRDLVLSNCPQTQRGGAPDGHRVEGKGWERGNKFV